MADIIGFITWNVNPEIFQLGPFSVRWYGLLFASGFLIGYYIGEKMFKWENVNPKWLDSLFMYLIIATIVGARLGHVFFYGPHFDGYNSSGQFVTGYLSHPLNILKIYEGGLASHGGAIGIMVALFFYSKYVTKRSILWTLDRVVIPTALVAALIRANLMNSEIYGVQTSLPWGFIFERNGETVAKHPTQIYEALCYLFGFILLMFMYWKGKTKDKPGMFLGIFFIIVFLSRFLIEFIKEDQEAFEATMSLNMGQWLSIPFVVFGLWLLIRSIVKPTGTL